ncbi:dimethylaniline monooxygenase 2 [Colletotrichum asianum]|uniref:Dimethylaniline monooxygenase 2 n=1 Tax=Colletotrichum asianum TaxID=702518 RepID=A0A8H3W0Y6_9PEZI|nr:dimethylaniline monooxygenase 2 [Colletotrichum asianum]
MVELAREGSVLPQTINPYQWADWVDQTAGTGEPRFCSIFMGSVYSPHINRIFDGKKKKWGGARIEIERLYKVANKKPKVNWARGGFGTTKTYR